MRGANKGGKRAQSSSPATDADASNKRRRTQGGKPGQGGSAKEPAQQPAHRRKRIHDLDAPVSSLYTHRVGSQLVGFPKWLLSDMSVKPSALKGALKRGLNLVKEVSKRKAGQFFLRPVDPKADGVPDYYQVVKDPVDLGAIQKAVEMGFYSFASAGQPSGIERLAADVGQVWANALAYNPANNVVSQSASELRTYCEKEFAKIIAEEAVDDATDARGPSCTRLLVMDKFVFQTPEGLTALPESMLQRNAAQGGIIIEGFVMPAVLEGGMQDADLHAMTVEGMHFELVGEGKEPLEVQAWAKTSDAWVLLRNPDEKWAGHAKQWLSNQTIVELTRRWAAENSSGMQYDKLMRHLAKQNNKGGEEAIKRALVDCAEQAAVLLEVAAQSGENAKLGQKEGAKLGKKLLAEAEKERSQAMMQRVKLPIGKGAADQQKRDAAAICGAVSGLISKLELELTREVAGLSPKIVVSKVDSKKAGGGGGGATAPAKEKAADDAASEPKGYWERDSEGKRRWVEEPAASATTSSKSTKKRKAGTGAGAGAGGGAEAEVERDGEGEEVQVSKRVQQLLKDKPLGPEVGGFASVLFDDQEWYVGKFTGFKNGKWHVMFADGDEDDISLPDPDCKVLPPASVMLQAADEAAGDIKTAMKRLLEGAKVPAGLAQNADEIKKSIAATRKSIKDSLNKLGAGKAKKGEGSVAEVRDNLFSRVRSKFVDSDKAVDGEAFDALVAEAVAVGKELDGPSEQQPASNSEDAAESGTTSSPAAAPAASAAASGKKAKGEKKESAAKDASATPGVPSTGKKGKGGKPKAAAAAASAASAASASASEGGGPSNASTPGNPKIKIKLVHTTPKTGSEDGGDVELDEIPFDDDEMDVDDSSPKVGASGKPVNIGEKAKADWRAMPPWLHKNSHIEVHWEGDWWQCKAMKVDGRKVLCHYVGGDEEEWVNFESGRIRPPSDNWDSAIAATPGETIEVRRPAEKKSSRKWIMAKVLEADDDNKTVKVQYMDEKNKDLANEWVSTDAKTCRPVSSGEADVPKAVPDGGKLDIKIRMTKYPWPNGETLAGDVSHEIVGSSLMMIQFMGTFGKAVLQRLRPVVDVVPGGLGPTGAPRAEDIAEWTAEWLQVMPDTLLDDVRQDEPPGYLMGAVLSLINVLMRKDKKDPKEVAISEMMVPDAMTLPALAARVVEKDLRDRNRRVVKERLEESLLSEDAVQEFNISKSWAYGKGSDKKPPAYRFDELEGRKVSIEGIGPFAGTSLTGETTVSDGQVRISCCGMTMREDDFEHFGAPPPGSKGTGSSIMVEASEDAQEGDEAAETPVELSKVMEAARLEGAEEAEAEVDWNLAMEQLLGGQLMACERKMAKALENATWSSMSFEMRWSLICLLTEIALGSDAVRSILSNPVEDAKAKGTPGRPANALLPPGTPGTPLAYGGAAVGTPGAAMTPGAGGAEDKKDDKKELYRVECIGSDRQGRRYFTFPWSRGKMAVEVPASDLQPSPYAKQGANRQCPYDEAPSWEFYTDEHLDALEAHFKHTEDHGEARLIKKIKKIREEEKGAQQPKDGEEAKDALASSAAVIAAPPAATPAPVAPAAPVAHAPADEAKEAEVEAAPPAIPLGMPGNTPAVTPDGLVPEVAPLPTPVMQPPVVIGLAGVAMPINAADAPAKPLAYVDQIKIFPYKGEYVAKEDETPVAICERYGICVDLMCKMNEEMYKGLHARARFKNGTHLQFPTPTLTTLCRSVTRSPKKILNDVINIIVTELEVMPLSRRVSSALKLLKQACADLGTIDPRTVADALITLEHALVLPTTPGHKPIQSDRLFKLEWLDQRRDDWVHRLKKATTLPQVAVALEEFHVVALVGVRHVRNVCVTRWMYRSETTRAEQTFVESMAKEYFCHMPDKGEIVFYTKQGHLLHLETFPQRIGDCLPDMDVGTCTVEETWNFKSTGNFHPQHTTLQLRRCPIAEDLVGHKITVTSFPTSKDMVLPQVCKVAKYNEEVGRQHLLQWDSGDPESWVCLDDAKWAITNPEDVGPSFFASIHCQQKLPGFILSLVGMRKIKAMKFNRGQRVRMWFWNGRGSVTTEGNFYTGTVINHKQAADPWNTVQVEWDATDGDDPDVSWACPWELRMWDGEEKPREPKPGTCMKDCVTTQAEAMRLPDGGKYVTEQEDLTPRQVAQATGVDLDLLVMINKGNYQGLTKLSKLLKNTKLRLPPRGVRYERKPVHGISQPMDQQQLETIAASNTNIKIQEFDKEDEKWWDGAWTSEMQIACSNLLRKIRRNRISGIFLSPVDPNEMGLEDYLDVIKTPMDLTTIEVKLENSEYSEPKLILSDMRLMLENCMAYNPEGTAAHRNAIQLWNFFEETWRDEKNGTRRRNAVSKYVDYEQGSPP